MSTDTLTPPVTAQQFAEQIWEQLVAPPTQPTTLEEWTTQTKLDLAACLAAYAHPLLFLLRDALGIMEQLLKEHDWDRATVASRRLANIHDMIQLWRSMAQEHG